MYTIKGETDYRPRLDAWDKRSELVLWEDLETLHFKFIFVKNNWLDF